MNVEIDEEQILREFDARLAALGPEPLEGEFISAQPSGGWNETLQEYELAESIHQGVMPAWQIGQKDKDGWQKALGDLGDRHAPGGEQKINNAGPLARLAYYTLKALVTNFDFQTMQFKPMKQRVNPEQPPPDEKTEEETPAAKPKGSVTSEVECP